MTEIERQIQIADDIHEAFSHAFTIEVTKGNTDIAFAIARHRTRWFRVWATLVELNTGRIYL